MKIARLYLKAYGGFTDRQLDLSGDANLHVIFGRNEAGKSTTLRALTGLLFGIDGRTPDNFLHPYPQLRVGATLLTAEGQRLSLMRRKAIKQTLFALDEESGTELTDQPLAEDSLSRLLGGLDEGLYRSLFGLDMDGLTRGSEALLAGKGEIGQSLFEAAAGLTSLQQLLGRLDQEAAALFKPRASTSVIHVAIKELDEKRKLAREATVRTSAWELAERLRRQAEAKHAKARQGLNELREEHRLLSRIAANLPLAAERSAKLVELEALQAIPLLPPEAAQQRISAEERLRSALDAQREAQGELDRLQPKRAVLVVREPLLAHAATVERLHHGAKDWRGAVERLPRIERAIESARAHIADQVAGIVPELAQDAAPARIRGLIPSPTLVARVRALAAEYAALHSGETQSAERGRNIRGALDKLRAELAAQPELAPLDALDAAREEAAGQGDLAGQQARMERDIAELAAALGRDAGALWSGTHDALLAVRVPLTATLHEFEAEYRRMEEERRALQAKDDELARDIGERERELRGLAAAGEIATFDQVQSVRLRRDAGWRQIRQGYIERSADPAQLSAGFDPALPLPVAYEGAVQEADRLADLLHADAGRAANYEITRQRIADMGDARSALDKQRDELDAAQRRLDARWGAVAMTLGQSDMTPAAALEWGQKHASWVERAGRLATLRQAQEDAAQQLAKIRAGLDRALTGCGFPGMSTDETLSAALLRAKAAVDAARRAATRRAELLGKIAQQEIDLADVASRLEALAGQKSVWQSQWAEAMAALQLRITALPDEAQARIDELDALAKALDEIAALAREAELEQEKRSRFEQELATLAGEVDEPMQGRDADHVVSRLYDALTAAREADRQRKQIDADIERETVRLKQSRLAESSQRERLAELMRRAGAESPDELPFIEAASARKQLLAARVGEIEAQFVSGAARPLAEVLAEVEGREMAATDARLAEIEMSLKAHEAETEAAHAEFIEANRAFNAIDGSDAAARAQQEAEELVARIARHARTYARTRLAQAVVARVVQSYREKHQGPVLRRAGEIYARITLGSFSGLVTDYDDTAQVLLGQRPDGTRVGVAGMSQGARDQLFLALRIAAIEEHLKQREAIPLVIDDLLVQFDDARASATLAVLAELAQHTQVLFFTHHGHLCELAENTLGAGSWQRHDFSAVAGSAGDAG